MMNTKEKKDNPLYIALVLVLMIGPFIAGPFLFVKKHTLAGILAFVIPWGCLVLIGILRKIKAKRDFYRIKNASALVDIIPVSDEETIRALRDNSALTFRGEPSESFLNLLYNWLNNESVLKEERLNLYTYDGALLKKAVGKRRKFGDEEKFMSVFLKDLDINETNERQFSLDHFKIGGRWLDDIVGNSK